MGDALHYLSDNIFIGFGSTMYRQRVGITMGTRSTCAPLVADLRLVCHEGNLLLSLSVNNQVSVTEAFNIRLRRLSNRTIVPTIVLT